MGVSVDDVRRVARDLPMSTEVVDHGRVRYRVGRMIWLAFSPDEKRMGFAYPKDERLSLVGTEPETFLMPRASDLRFNWVEVRLSQLDHARMVELVHDAWRMVVPRSVAAHHLGRKQPPGAP